MNDKIFKQYKDPWKDLPYPTYSSDFGENGCGCCSCTHIAIEQESKKDWTPENLRQWMIDKGYVVAGHGTEWQGIYDTLKHIGHDNVVWVGRSDPMSMAWAELDKGNRIGVMLVNDGTTPDKTVWTTDGHYISFNKYWKDEQGNHWFRIKDSGWRDHDGDFCYERSLMHALPQLWIVERIGEEPTPPTPPTPTPTDKLVVDGVGGYETVKRLQELLNLADPDGLIARQRTSLKKYYPSLTAVSFASSGSSHTVWALQRWLGLSDPDGIWGSNTSKGLQKKLRDCGYFAPDETLDGIFGTKSMKAFQTALNNGFRKVDPPSPPTPTTKYKVIDVSEHQKKIDWAKVKADGVVGAIIRYAEDDYLDPYFAENMKGAKGAGLHIGAYIYSWAKTEAEAENYAVQLYNACKPYGCDMPLYIDLEKKGYEQYANVTANAFIRKMKELGGFAGVYANLNWWNNYLTKVTPPARWVAQYYDRCEYKGGYGMWQYTSKGSVNGISGVVDMNECYVAYWDIIKPEPVPPTPPTPSGHYTGTYPTLRVVKSNAQVIADAIKFGKWIASNNDFHYGWGQHSHHNGCYFCDTQPSSKKSSGIKMWETTYCCNPFVHACWAHGGLVPKALSICSSYGSWDFGTGSGSYHTCSLFTKVSTSSLKAGDVLCSDSHVALYIGNGQVVRAGHSDDNVPYSSDWNSSISIGKWNGYTRAYRFNSSVDADIIMRKGEVSERVADLQRYLVWYGALPQGEEADGIYGEKTFKAVVKMQTDFFGASEADGTIGNKTIAKMKEVVR